MLYISTRDSSGSGRPFSEIVLEGLAPDGGLYLPQTVPELGIEELKVWSHKTYAELTETLLRLFAPELEGEIGCSLHELILRSTSQFRHPEVTPLRQLGDSALYVGELFHGPTYAFKDVALQFLGQVFERLLHIQGGKLFLLGATSGDTGGAAIYGMRGMQNIQLSILHPHNSVSEVQRKQMCSVLDENICNIAIRGNFDQCQSMVKEIMQRSKRDDSIPQLGAINSINWGRILAQITYYFALYFRLTAWHSTQIGDLIRFIVPTGNFGNVLAGFFARSMGLPIELHIATNQNDILQQLFSRNSYQVSDRVQPSFAPAMDVVQPSNFERYLWFLFGGDSAAVSRFIQISKSGKPQKFSPRHYAQLQRDFTVHSADDRTILSAIQDCYQCHNYLLDPHSACAYQAYQELDGEVPSICLATAHPAKFPEAYAALARLGKQRQLPASQIPQYQTPAGLNFADVEERCSVLGQDTETLLQFLQVNAWH